MRSNGVSGSQHVRAVVAIAAVLLLGLALASPAARAATPGISYTWLSGASFADADNFQVNPLFDTLDVDPVTGNIISVENFNANDGNAYLRVHTPDANAGGLPLTTFGTSSFQASGVAVDPADGSLYVTYYQGGTVEHYLSDGAAVPTYSVDTSFSPPAGVANSAGGVAVNTVAHEVVVSGSTGTRIYRLNATTGAVISSFDGSDTAQGRFVGASAVAIGPSGSIYVVDADTVHLRVERFSSSGVSQGALPIGDGARPLSIATNPQNGNVYVVVALNNRLVLEGFTATGQRTFVYPISGAMTGSPTGLGADPTTGRIYLAFDSGLVHTFAPATAPGLDPPAISQISGTSAHASTNVAPGGETTTAHIEYCPATAACSSFFAADPNDSTNPWTAMPDHPGLGGNGEVAIDDDLGGLVANTSYRVRVLASNALTESTSDVTTFTTALVVPTVQTGPAADVTDSQAELTGTIGTIGAQTTYHFEYGLTTNYGASAPAGAEGVAGSSRAPRTFERTITGLQPGTTYHYRLVAHNAAGTAYGADSTFTTLGTDQVAPRRGYEQVTPVDKRGASLNAIIGFQAAADGSALEYVTTAASSDAASSVLQARSMSRRGASSWLDWQHLDPPINVSRSIIETGTHAVSADFTHAFVVSNRALTPGAIENGGNLYVKDLATGAYTLVAAVNGLDAYLAIAGADHHSMYLAGAPDFSWIVFDSETPLLPGAPATAMYRWTRAGGLALESRLPDGSVPSGNVSKPEKFRLDARQVSDDGNTIYFALTGADAGVYRRANGQTTAISVSHRAGDPTTPQPGEIDGVSRDGRYAIFRSGQLTDDAAAGAVSLYQYDAVTGELTHLGTAADFAQATVVDVADDGQTVYFYDGSDTVVWRHGALQTVAAGSLGRVFDDGTQALSSPNGRYLSYRGADDNVYLYDADAETNVCPSCPPDGNGAGDPHTIFGNRTVSNRAPQVVTDGGMMFFDTAARLVSADHNGSRDVYAYRNGHLTLISPGDGNFTARFADASLDGSDVFFTTAEPLVGQDVDQALDLYDARVGGGFPGQSPPAPPAPCAKTECGEATTGPVTSPPVVSPPQPPGPATPPTNQERVRLSLAKVSFGAKSVRISFKASQRGRLKVTGSRVSTTVRNVAKAGTYSITVPLSKKARALLKAHRKFKVSMKVNLAGGWGSASAKYSRTLGN
jgi:hypothetical protein